MVGCSVRRDRIRPSPLCREKSVAWDLKVGSDGFDQVWMVTSPIFNRRWFLPPICEIVIHGSMRANQVSFPSSVALLLLGGSCVLLSQDIARAAVFAVLDPPRQENECCLPKPGMKASETGWCFIYIHGHGNSNFYRLPLSCPGALWHRLPRWRRNTVGSARHEDHEAPAVSFWWQLTFTKAIMAFPPIGSWHGPTTEYHAICLDCLDGQKTKSHKADWDESTTWGSFTIIYQVACAIAASRAFWLQRPSRACRLAKGQPYMP